MNDALVYTEAAVLGAVAGIRSMSAPTVVSQLSESGLMPQEGSPAAWLNHPTVGKVLKVLATGEMVADKLPFLPDRTQIGPLAARAISGSISGAALTSAAKRPWWAGALIGAGAAVGAAYGFTKLRKWMSEEQNVPTNVIGVVEDAVVAGAAYLVLSSVKSANGAAA
jgi:uncharacterized membrane protein